MLRKPSIDAENPLYCPDVPATTYLRSLRRRVQRRPTVNYLRATTNDSDSSPFHRTNFVSSFARLISHALLSNEDCVDYGTPGTFAAAAKQPLFDDSPLSSYSGPDIDVDLSENTFAKYDTQLESHLPPKTLPLKRKRSEVYFFNRNKRPRPSDSIVPLNDSFAETKHRIIFPKGERDSSPRSDTEEIPLPPGLDHTRKLQNALYGPPVGTESPRGIHALIQRLEALMPGIRLRKRLDALDINSHQDIADFLGQNGYLNQRILNALRSSEIESLTMGESLRDENGLNLGGRDSMSTFSKPNSFLFLSELSFCNTPLRDSDIGYIHHLPRLSTLFLSDTGVGNEAWVLLVPLKRSLKRLSVAMNPRIDDDAIPAVLLLHKLSLLSILDTGVTIVGLRRLAKTIDTENRIVDIEIPDSCEGLPIKGMHSMYLVDIAPPLVTSPSLCAQLSHAALKRNLAAHNTINPDILTSGTKAEMKERLEGLLRTREMDLLVRGMIWGEEEAAETKHVEE